MLRGGVSSRFADMIKANIKHCTREYRRREEAGVERLGGAASTSRRGTVEIRAVGTLAGPPREFPEPDGPGAARLDGLEQALAGIGETFPCLGTDVEMCRMAGRMLEGAWYERASSGPLPGEGAGLRMQDASCSCVLCSQLPEPPRRHLRDYAWRRSDGLPLAVKTWPYRKEFDCVLTGGWVWNRSLQDAETGLGLRHRYEDDILTFPEYKRAGMTMDIAGTARCVEEGLAEDFSINGARALVSGLFTEYKRCVDEYWIGRHRAGSVSLPQSTPLDMTTYTMLQTMDCLWWHVPPDDQLWLEENLTTLVLSRVVDDMVDVRADSVTGEINNFWLASMPVHDKAALAACVIALNKYQCMPEALGVLWNVELVGNTAVWMALNGRHALWFDGITGRTPAADDCVLCRLQPNPCTGLLTSGVTLRVGERLGVQRLGPRAAELSARCRSVHPEAWETFHAELGAFEALHGEWHGDVDTTWEILRRTYVAGVLAGLAGGEGARDVQDASGPLGADLFHTLSLGGAPGWRENTALLVYMFGCAHPHFLWNTLGHACTSMGGDWLDG